MTIKIFALTLLFALPLGLVICFGSMSKFSPLRYLVKFFVWVIRGTPLMLQLITIFYVPGLIGQWAKGAQIDNAFINFLATWTVPDRFFAAMTAFVINYACYFSEIYRGGIESMPRGQYEAGAVLGMTKPQVFFRIAAEVARCEHCLFSRHCDVQGGLWEEVGHSFFVLPRDIVADARLCVGGRE